MSPTVCATVALHCDSGVMHPSDALQLKNQKLALNAVTIFIMDFKKKKEIINQKVILTL